MSSHEPVCARKPLAENLQTAFYSTSIQFTPSAPSANFESSLLGICDQLLNKTNAVNDDVDSWQLETFHLFWFGDGSGKNRGLVGDVLRWLCYSKSDATIQLVFQVLASEKFKTVCAAFGYDAQKFTSIAATIVQKQNNRTAIRVKPICRRCSEK